MTFKTCQASSRPIFFALSNKLSATLGRPSEKRSPFHSEVKKDNSSFEIVCADRIPEIATKLKTENTNALIFIIIIC